MIDYGLVFLTGLFSTAHCVGMCGVIVLAYSAQPTGENPAVPQWLLHTAYNGGRILSYALLGAVVGMAGMALSAVQQAASIVAIVGGATMILAGIAMLGIVPLPTTITLGGNFSGLRKLHARLLMRRSIPGKMSLGMLTPLLPCGILYAMVAKAATVGSPAAGALTMAIFGAGMAPGLLILGSLSSLISAKLRKGAEKIAAVVIILMGVVLLLRGFHIPFLSFIPVGVTDHHSCCSE